MPNKKGLAKYKDLIKFATAINKKMLTDMTQYF